MPVRVLMWARQGAFTNENPLDERASVVERLSVRDAYYALCVVMVAFVMMALAPDSWLASYKLDGHGAIIFVCVAASSLSFAVQCFSYVFHSRV